MAPSSSLVNKLKVQLKLSISRLRMVQQKDEALAKQQRRAMAVLLEQGKFESARIRVENIIRSDISTELLEILELYCELLLARAGLLESPTNNGKCDNGLEEAVQSLIYAAPRTEIKELQIVRQLLMEKYGKEFALIAMENREGKVAQRVLVKLKVEPPERELVELYLMEIARTYGIEYHPKSLSSGTIEGGKNKDEEGDVDMDMPSDDDDGGNVASTARKPKAKNAAEEEDMEEEEEEMIPTRRRLKREDTEEELRRTSPPRNNVQDQHDDGLPQGKSPISIAPPSPRVDNINPKIKLPLPVDLQPKFGKKKNIMKGGDSAGGDTEMSGSGVNNGDEVGGSIGGGGSGNNSGAGIGSGQGSGKGKGNMTTTSTKTKISDLDELAARFAALKK
ncbi:MAG: hypothetical protein M1823_005286 [Watsoniomyces obsoletus]|nr:MAG: hypothetical protein M1823_005286 [Watsoniomyces obsoletus]